MTTGQPTESERQIDREQVRHIAFLSRLALSDEEVETFSRQLSTIVDYFDRLEEVDLDDVPPYRQRPMARGELREDEVTPTMSRQDFLANAPRHQDGHVQVPVVLEVPDEG
jgi:aspartyl-tRNA(Asn)/glutamyl-tRNA(Gln) amidotransferase subunit C